jgi:hypothetical protein
MRKNVRPAWLIIGLAAPALALLAFAWMITAHAALAAAADTRNPPSALRAPQYATALVHGRVLWKNTEDVAPGVLVMLKDATSKDAVMQAETDATGWYTLTVGVGSWLLDIPSTAQYYGYAQELTALPHGEYVLDFAISTRPASDTAVQPTAAPAATPVPTVAAPAANPPGTLPANGQPADPTLFVILGIAALAIIGLGVVLLRRSRG